MMAQDLIECNYQELLNKNSFQGGAGLTNAALNLVSCLFQFFFCKFMLRFMSMCSTRASGSITGFYVHKGKQAIYVLMHLLRNWCNALVQSLCDKLATRIHIVYACVRVLIV